jgi:dienelactone hydrolase
MPFPAEPRQGSVYRSLSRPEGAGPFPAVVLLHTCAGVRDHVLTWADWLREQGYVALITDSFTPRGAGIVCGRFQVSVDEVAADAFAAAAHLRSLPFVDGGRVGAMGFSYGAMAGLRLASSGYRGGRPGFGAVVAFYPACTPDLLSSGAPRAVVERFDNLGTDIDTPLLILIGDADDDTPARQCTGRAEALARAGRPVSITVNPGVTHAVDQPSATGRITPLGHVYRYDQAATEDAARRSLEFFSRHLRRR